MLIRKSAKKQEDEVQAQRIADAERRINERVEQEMQKSLAQKTQAQICATINKWQEKSESLVNLTADIYESDPESASMFVAMGGKIEKAILLAKRYNAFLKFDTIMQDVMGELNTTFNSLKDALDKPFVSVLSNDMPNFEKKAKTRKATFDLVLEDFEKGLDAWTPAGFNDTYDESACSFERKVQNKVNQNKADTIDD